MSERNPKPGDIVYLVPEELEDCFDADCWDTSAVVIELDGKLRSVYLNDNSAPSIRGKDGKWEKYSHLVASLGNLLDPGRWAWTQADAIRKAADRDVKYHQGRIDIAELARKKAEEMESQTGG